MTQGVEMLPVEQSDRDMAAEAVQSYRDQKNGNWQQRIREGQCDDGAMVQAFARYRIAHTHPAATGSVREALKIGEQFLNACNSAWSCGEPYHRVKTMMDKAEEFQQALYALAAAPTPDAAASEAGEVEQANDLAREFYARHGYEVPGGYRFDRATHPQEVEAWECACVAIEMLTHTDAQNAADAEADASTQGGAEG